jgi:response regulator RpfG family c-di-GMP phosphodiesterase
VVSAIQNDAGLQFDPQLTEAFLSLPYLELV